MNARFFALAVFYIGRFVMKRDHLARQARDRHKENSKEGGSMAYRGPLKMESMVLVNEAANNGARTQQKPPRYFSNSSAVETSGECFT
jgi:hypothetical protein